MRVKAKHDIIIGEHKIKVMEGTPGLTVGIFSNPERDKHLIAFPIDEIVKHGGKIDKSLEKFGLYTAVVKAKDLLMGE